jgi:purine nucleosidase
MVSTTSSIILDCDPGHDDAIAILLAVGNPSIKLLAVTTVAGNQTLAKVSHNALSVARVAGITAAHNIPFAAGASLPIVRDLEVAEAVHGTSGLDGPVLPEPSFALDNRHGVDVIIDTVRAAAEPVTLVATGPLTNIALAVRKAPDLAQLVKEVVLMGGAIEGGNWTPCAEFNIAVDPDAARIVFTAGWKVVMVGLDVTHRALATQTVRERIAKIATFPSQFAGGLLDFFQHAYKVTQGFDAPPVHDPVALAYVIDPSVLTVVNAPIDVETQGRITTGMTVVDLRVPAPEGCKTWAATGVDVDRFWDLVVDALERIGEPEPGLVAAPGV